LSEYAWLADTWRARERRLDYRAAVIAMLLSQSKSFDVTQYFPSLREGEGEHAGAPGRRVYEIEEIPDDWTQITDPEEARKWATAFNLAVGA
jgi:hypothetical protein